jgi:hypothetical protein
MGTKLNIEYIRSEFERYGYTLLSEEYTGSKNKLYYRCTYDHEHSTVWDSWKQGKRCPTCADIKLTYEFVKQSFESCGYTLISKEYINSGSRLNYECPKGHKHSIVWDNWKQGSRCLTCAGNVKLTIEYVKDSFEKENYILLSKEYTNNHTKLDYICSNNHEYSMVWINWKKGKRCPTCADIKFSGSGHPNWNGGTSYEPYCPIWSDKDYKEDIKLRDGNRCLNPDCWKKDKLLSIHHIDYNKKSCSPKNLITVCRSCNARANKDREWHTAWYQALMYRRYKYEY